MIKTKADIAQVKKKLAEVNDPAGANETANDKGSGSEPPEIRQLRLQIHQYGDLIAQATRDQKKLQEAIAVYQGRVAQSPAVEEQYKELARDYDNAQKVYQDDLAKQSTSKMATQAQQQQEGEQMALLNPANLPDSPSFPNRPIFAAGGLGAGLVLGLGLALWLEVRDKCIRTEADAEAAMDLPVLVTVPWVIEADLQRQWRQAILESKETRGDRIQSLDKGRQCIEFRKVLEANKFRPRPCTKSFTVCGRIRST